MGAESAPSMIGVVRGTSSLYVSVWKQRAQAGIILLARPPKPDSKAARDEKVLFKHV